jgi:hypothetical protein
MVPVPTFEKLWFRFRFLRLKSYSSHFGSSFISKPTKANYKKNWENFCQKEQDLDFDPYQNVMDPEYFN